MVVWVSSCKPRASLANMERTSTPHRAVFVRICWSFSLAAVCSPVYEDLMQACQLDMSVVKKRRELDE